ncbi:MAG: elongation factor Ts [Clostridia bacterium]|nr:elongation factor Ts [Clostridia bacterium]
MAFTAQDVKRLREMTNAGMMDCKKALSETDGDFDAAIAFLREKGLAAAAKKAGRVAAEGMVYVNVAECGAAVMVEVNSETDFVAKNEEFQKFCAGLGQAILENNPADVVALAECKFPGSDLTVSQMQNEKVLTIGENIQIRRFVRLDNTMKNVAYVHGGGKIGVLVRMNVEGIENNDALVTLGRDLGMQAASMRPQWLNREEVPAETLEAEKHILMQQTINEGKPEAVAQKIVMGRINKFYEENCLLEQAFVKENKISVQKHVDAVAKELGGKIAIENCIRFEKGEGIAKREDDFAAEVAKMTGK